MTRFFAGSYVDHDTRLFARVTGNEAICLILMHRQAGFYCDPTICESSGLNWTPAACLRYDVAIRQNA
jgi:hypothetical protein